NRALLLNATARALGNGPSQDQETALLIVDLDRFRDVNDTLGRAQGDLVLKEVAARVESDRFGILLPDIPRTGDAERAARKVLIALSRHFDVAGASLSVDATVGIACAPSH